MVSKDRLNVPAIDNRGFQGEGGSPVLWLSAVLIHCWLTWPQPQTQYNPSETCLIWRISAFNFWHSV